MTTQGTNIASTDDSSAIFGDGGGNHVYVSGSVFAEVRGIELLGDANRVVIGPTGQVGLFTPRDLASDSLNPAIQVLGAGAEVINHGTVDAGMGIDMSGVSDATVENTGTISGINGIVIFAAAGAFNYVHNSGEISGTEFGIGSLEFATPDYTTVITNTGTISSAGATIFGSDGVEIVYNSGDLVGEVSLGGGDDYFYGIGGSVMGGVSGGAGDDTYVVDDSATDLIENAGEGIDTVVTSISFSLEKTSDNIENLTLDGADDLTGIGNALDNKIKGSTGDNRLRGLAGKDKISGNVGDDRIWGGRDNDKLDGGTGDDVIHGQKGKDKLNGGDGENLLLGNSGNDRLSGMDGDDTLDGGSGRDTLTGGEGYDVFRFSHVADSPAGSHFSRIKDFTHGQDVIDLSGVVPGTLTFIGTEKFSATGAEVHVQNTGRGTMIYVAADSNATTDMLVLVEGLSADGFTASDFIL